MDVRAKQLLSFDVYFFHIYTVRLTDQRKMLPKTNLNKEKRLEPSTSNRLFQFFEN
jgi:hypothetical protein